jgi:hypothetical protein
VAGASPVGQERPSPSVKDRAGARPILSGDFSRASGEDRRIYAMATTNQPTFEEVLAAGVWKPIPNCPGRYRLLSLDATLSPAAIIGRSLEVVEFTVSTARDSVLVVKIAGGGMISYRKPNGTYVHTLNTQNGFDRKLNQLGIEIQRLPGSPGSPDSHSLTHERS